MCSGGGGGGGGGGGSLQRAGVGRMGLGMRLRGRQAAPLAPAQPGVEATGVVPGNNRGRGNWNGKTGAGYYGYQAPTMSPFTEFVEVFSKLTCAAQESIRSLSGGER